MQNYVPIIDGATRLYAIIGDPIVQVKSPGVFNDKFREAGINAVLLPVHIRPDNFEAAIRGMKASSNLDGLLVTIPYKVRCLDFVESLLPTATRVGAVNAIRVGRDGSWTGDMFDGKGCLEGMRRAGITINGAKVMLWGAGGAGSAIADALVEQGAGAITIYDQDAARAFALMDVLQAAHPGCTVECAGPSLDRHVILINATPIGMAPGDGLPADPGKLTPQLAVVDIIGTPAVTPLLAAAEGAGCRTMGGKAMVESQADTIFSFFTSETRTDSHPA